MKLGTVCAYPTGGLFLFSWPRVGGGEGAGISSPSGSSVGFNQSVDQSIINHSFKTSTAVMNFKSCVKMVCSNSSGSCRYANPHSLVSYMQPTLG